MVSKLFCVCGVGVVSWACVIVLPVACRAVPGEPMPRGSFHAVPPGVEAATVQALPAPTGDGNALLEVTFDKSDARVAKGVPIFPHGKQVLLRDDGAGGDVRAGDGVFSAVVDFDFDEVAEQAAMASRALPKAGPQPVFFGREIVGVETDAMVRERLTALAKWSNARELITSRAKLDLFPLRSAIPAADVDPERSLLITAASVVTDAKRTVDPCTGAGNPNGVWTFKHLVTQMTLGTGVDPADFVERWLRLWSSNQTVSSGFVAAPRPSMVTRVIDPWPRTAAGKLDLDKSPFRLAAIVNRIDLAENVIYGGGSAGEGRFIFGLWDRQAGGCQFLPFSLIFEYGVPRTTCHEIRNWAKEWLHLSSLPLGSPAYLAALEAITEQFAKAGAAPGKPNGSALNQLRTNENALNPLWELREFRLDAATHLLFEDTVKQTPAETLNNTSTLADYINANEAAIKLDQHVVPDHFPGAADPFLGATSLASPGQLGTHFRAPGVVDNDARFHFSLNTCSACHIRETSTNLDPPGNTGFLHVDPRTIPAGLSRFLTGSTPSIADSPDPFTVADPVVAATTHSFNDLDRRRIKLASLAGSSCLRSILVPPRRLFERRPRIGPDGVLPPIDDPRLPGLHDPVRMTH